MLFLFNLLVKLKRFKIEDLYEQMKRAGHDFEIWPDLTIDDFLPHLVKEKILTVENDVYTLHL